MSTILRSIRRSLERLVRRVRWTESQRISPDGQIVYTVRNRPGSHEQIRSRYGEWCDTRTAEFSIVPGYEDHHREMFKRSVPYSPNAKGLCDGAAKGTNEH